MRLEDRVELLEKQLELQSKYIIDGLAVLVPGLHPFVQAPIMDQMKIVLQAWDAEEKALIDRAKAKFEAARKTGGERNAS